MGVTEFLVEVARNSKLGKFVGMVRLGWTNYSFIFYIGGVSAILGEFFGIAGWLSTIVTVLFFYYAGRFKKRIDLKNRARKRTRRASK